jgi:hypothetical protein
MLPNLPAGYDVLQPALGTKVCSQHHALVLVCDIASLEAGYEWLIVKEATGAYFNLSCCAQAYVRCSVLLCRWYILCIFREKTSATF